MNPTSPTTDRKCRKRTPVVSIADVVNACHPRLAPTLETAERFYRLAACARIAGGINLGVSEKLRAK